MTHRGGDFGKVPAKGKESDRYRNELTRIRQSASFKIGTHLVRAIERPWRFFILPVTIPLLFWKIMLDMLSRRSSGSLPIEIDEVGRRSIVMFPTEGGGFSHFTRMLGLAKRIRLRDPSVEIIFFTSTPMLHILSKEGFPSYHITARNKFDEMDTATWNNLTEQMLSTVLDVHQPMFFIFDGIFPYKGMLNAISDYPEIEKIWMRLGMISQPTNNSPVDTFNHFDVVINSKESPDNMDGEAIEPTIVLCDPILLHDAHELTPREEFREQLGLSDETVLVHLQLPTNRIRDSKLIINICLKILSTYDDVHILLNKSLLSPPIPNLASNITVISEISNGAHSNASDFAIITGDYNPYQEAIRHSIPALCIPKKERGGGTQLARVLPAEKAGSMIVLRDATDSLIAVAIERLMDSEVRKEMQGRCEKMRRPNGANQISKWLISQIE